MIQHYLKISLRNLLKYKTHCLISAICLAIGLVCFTIIGYLMDGIDGNVRQLPGFERRIDFRLIADDSANGLQSSMLARSEVQALEEMKVAGIESISYMSYRGRAEMMFIDRNQQERPFQLNIRSVNGAFWIYYDCTLLYGNRLPQAIDEVVISESCARKVFGKENPVGMLVTHVTNEEAEDKKTYKIVNVSTDLSVETNVDADLYFLHQKNNDNNLWAQGMLAADAELQKVNKMLQQLKVNRNGTTMHFTAIRLSDQFDDPGRLAIKAIVILLSALILLSGIINFLKFIIQMFYNRQRELALRKCVGSTVGGLYALLFSEVVWMCVFSLLLSLVLVEVIVPYVYTYIPQDRLFTIDMPQLIGKQLTVFLQLLMASMLVILLPIYRLQKVSAIRHISKRNQNHFFRNFMMEIQLIICIFFLGAASFLAVLFTGMNSHVYNPLSEDEAAQVVCMNINSISMNKQKDVILNEIKKMPLVESITYTHRNQAANSNSYIYTTYLCADSSTAHVLVEGGSPHYFDFFHIPFRGKRVDAETQGVVYVSERFSELLASDSTDGIVKLGEKTYQIGGVYKALYKEDTKADNRKGSVFFPNRDDYSYYLRIAASEDATKVIKQIEGIYTRYVPRTIPLTLLTLDKAQSMQNSVIEMMRNVAFLLAVVSIMLVVLSIYSSISMDTMSRQKEVVIRKINGATPRDIALIFGKTYIVLYLLSFAIAFPLVCLLCGKMDEFSYLTPFSFVMIGLGLFIGVAMLVAITTGYKIYRIMHINPAEIITTE